VFVLVRGIIVVIGVRVFRVLEKIWHVFRHILSKLTCGCISAGSDKEEKIDIKVRKIFCISPGE
jgi:hypothetical protein